MDWHRQDALAGVTTAAVVIPRAMAYATIAGLPVQVGLYTALVPLSVYALLGHSRALSVSTTSTLAALTGAAIGTVANGDPERAIAATTMLGLLVGVLLLAASVLRLGFIADFISHPVLVGFKAGTGLLIAVGQLGKVLGIEQTGDNFFAEARSALSHLGEIDWATAGLGVGTIALLLGLKRWAPSVPGALVAVGAGIAMGYAGLEVALTGAVPSGLPHPVAPDLDLIRPLLPAAAGVALPAGGGMSQTAFNDGAGARTRLAGAFTGLVALLTLLFLTGVFAHLPQATLGALVLVSAMGLVALGPLREIRAIQRRGFLLGLLTLVSVLALGVLQGVLVEVITSMLVLVHLLDHPDIRVVEKTGGTLVVRIVGSLYFANIQRVRHALLALVDEHQPDKLVLDLAAVPAIDITTLTLLPAFDRKLAGRGVTLHLAALNPEPLADFRRSPAYPELGDRLHRDAHGTSRTAPERVAT